MGYRMEIPEGEYLSGVAEVTEKLQGFIDELEEAGSQGLVDAALYILGEAAQRAPMDTGNLRGSGYVTVEGQQVAEYEQPLIAKEDAHRGVAPPPGKLVITGPIPGEATHAEIGFIAPYAAAQHEQVHYTHKEGRSKYLESVLVDEQDRILNTIAGKMQEVIDGA